MTKAEQEWSLIEALVYCKGKRLTKKSCAGCPYAGTGCAIDATIAKLKAQEPREPHYTKLEYIVNGMPVAINHPECPRCYDNGLVLWDAEIERGAAYCKRCGQAVKWE